MNTLTTILSIIAGGVITYLIARWQMKKNKIIHFSLNSYKIGKGLSDEFPAFKLYYQGKTLANNVIVLEGGFINSGRNDISGLKGSSDFKLILPEGCNVKDVVINPSTKGLKVSVNKNQNTICYGINGIFKSDEFFKYKAILETSEDTKMIFDQVKFQHRILNTEPIKNTHIGQQRKFSKRFIIFSILAFVLPCLSLLTSFIYQKMDFKVYNKASNAQVEVYVDPQSHLHITDNAMQFPFLSGKTITVTDFENNYGITPITNYVWNSSKTIILISLIPIILLYFSLTFYLFFGKNGHIIRVLKNNDI